MRSGIREKREIILDKVLSTRVSEKEEEEKGRPKRSRMWEWGYIVMCLGRAGRKALSSRIYALTLTLNFPPRVEL